MIKWSFLLSSLAFPAELPGAPAKVPTPRKSLIWTAALSAFLLFAPATLSAQSGACHLISSSHPVPQDFGAAYNVLSSAQELLLQATCTDSGATVTAGSGAENQLVYEQGYEWRGGRWIPFSFEGARKGGSWIVGQASARLPRTSEELSQNNSFVAYVCQRQNNRWYCGCRGPSCTQSYWQLQAFQGEAPSSGGGGSGGGTGATSDRTERVKNAPGQVSDAYLRSADMYYLSSETSASARETWNDHHEEWRDTWHEAAPRIRVKVNDKTQISTGGWGQSPYIESDGVVNFNHRTGWISDASPYRNYKHVFMRLMTTGSTGVAEWLKEDRDYESGFTFWQGGTRNWMRDADMKIAIWQVHGGTSPVPIYVQGNFGGNMGIDGFWAGREGGSRNRFQYKFPDQSHDAIHVIKVQFRLGDRGYVRIFHNGKKVFDSGIVSMNYDKSWSDFMNYSAYKNASVEQIIYMDRLYFTEVRNPGQ